MMSPAFVPEGWPFVSSPAIRTTERAHMLPNQTSSLPSMFKPNGMFSAGPVKPIGAGWVPSGRIMLTAPVLLVGGPTIYFTMAAVAILNCSMIDAPSGMTGGGVLRSMLLAAQTLPFESNARARTPIPARKVSTLDGSLAGNRKTVYDCELLNHATF